MEEELNENELEERLYSMLHYADDTQAYVEPKQDGLKLIENAPRSTLRRYWKTSGDYTSPQHKENNACQKINTTKDAPATKNNTDKSKPKEEKVISPSPEKLPANILFQSPVPKNVKKTIIIENESDENIVELESSDEDEVIEVALPPKPTITIDSSEDEGSTEAETKSKQTEKSNALMEREVSASPVPSVQSSMSDEFIRNDCIALNISRRPENHSFDFSAHVDDFLGSDGTPKEKKRKKNKKSATSTPITAQPIVTPEKSKNNEECFATPKSKAKNKKQRTKSYTVTDKSIPSADVYDSDSNQSLIDKSHHSYTVTESSLPNADVYESDSSETLKHTGESVKNSNINKNTPGKPISKGHSSDSSASIEPPHKETPKNSKRKDSIHEIIDMTDDIIDLTDNTITAEEPHINESIVMANVTGFTESEDYGDEIMNTEAPQDITKFGSTKIPAILYEDLDFDNLKGKDKVCKNRKYSLTTLRAEMEKFYNESWGGENFNHREIQKSMSRDKSLWAIDPKDRMPAIARKKTTCNYCNRAGHRDDACRLKPPVCYMCGNTGHMEPRCPSKICVNCGSPNHMYSTACRNCCGWSRLQCAECGQPGHPASHCPDVWRRYHNTLDAVSQLEENHFSKKHYQLFCSCCARRGHLAHSCRVALPFSGLPINSPHVHRYQPVYPPSPPLLAPDRRQSRNQDATVSSATTPSRNDKNKRPSKSPSSDGHINKRRKSLVDTPAKSPTAPQRKTSQSKENDTDKPATENITTTAVAEKTPEPEKAPDFIPIFSSNHDKKGQMIQDNEVSDTSDVITSARIYVTNDILEKLKTNEGQEWLKTTTTQHNVSVQNTEVNSFLSITGKLADQEAFQACLRDWTRNKSLTENDTMQNSNLLEVESDPGSPSNNIPKNRNNVLRKISKALESLNGDIGDPHALYKELNYLQHRHEQLLRQQVVNPKQLANNRDHINEMLRKLNMVLLGQAGLGGGARHLRELAAIHSQLASHRQKKISASLRCQIGQHYHCIFTAAPRDDYGELLQLYRGARAPAVARSKKEKFKIKPNKKKKVHVIPNPSSPPAAAARDSGAGEFMPRNNLDGRKPIVEKTRSKLVFYQRRLLSARPGDSVLRKTRGELVRQLRAHLAALARGAASARALRRMRRVQEQAQVFLNNV